MPLAREYERSTSASSRSRLPSPVRDELDRHIEGRLLTVDPDAPAWVTHSKKLKAKRGLFSRLTGPSDPDTEHLTIVVIGARDLIWVTHGEKRGTNVMSARLVETDVRMLSDDLPSMQIEDNGANITGFPTSVEGHASRGTVFMGLGPPEGDRAYEAMREAVRAAKAA